MNPLGLKNILSFSTACFLLSSLFVAHADKKEAKPDTTKAASTASSAAANKPVSFDELKKTWTTYAKGLDDALKMLEEKGTINYEKDVLKKMINHIKPVIDSMNIAQTEAEKNDARSMVNLKLIGLRIIEREYKRAETIRLLMINVNKTGDKDLFQDLKSLAQLSNEIFNLEVNLANAQARFATSNARISRQSSGMATLKKAADDNAALLEKLKTENPEIYKKLTGKDKAQK